MTSLIASLIRYSDGNPYGYQREALSGIVQTLLITKHMLFVGFSLTDDAFNQVSTLDWHALWHTLRQLLAHLMTPLIRSYRPSAELCIPRTRSGEIRRAPRRARPWAAARLLGPH